jgi:hypothetical protein
MKEGLILNKKLRQHLNGRNWNQSIGVELL